MGIGQLTQTPVAQFFWCPLLPACQSSPHQPLQGNGTMVHPIVGMRNISHIADNTRGLGLHLDSADLASIQSVLDRSSGPNGDCYSFEREN